MHSTEERYSTTYRSLREALPAEPATWLVTGAAGFIGSHLSATLLELGQRVRGLDNFATGNREHINLLKSSLENARENRPNAEFEFLEGDIRDLDTCRRAVEGADYVLHQAALGSVPRSIADPLTTNAVNIGGFLNMLVAARDAEVRRFVYAASSSTYGDHEALPKVEDRIGEPISPYAVTKYVNELYANVFARSYGMHPIGLRYFNVFGPRQDPDGPYAAVIPRWIRAMLSGEPVEIYGDGETSRDFCYVENAVQANLLAARAPEEAANRVYNVAVGQRTSLSGLLELIQSELSERGIEVNSPVHHSDFRAGDVRHSQADISLARGMLGYNPTHTVAEGLSEAMDWYVTALRGDAR